MKLLPTLLAVIADQEPLTTFHVCSIWVLDKCIVVESTADPIEAQRGGRRLLDYLNFHFPSVTVSLYPPDIDGTTIAISF